MKIVFFPPASDLLLIEKQLQKGIPKILYDEAEKYVLAWSLGTRSSKKCYGHFTVIGNMKVKVRENQGALKQHPIPAS